MNDILIVYDDTQKPDNEIKNIIGDKTFGNVILQRRTLKQRFLDITERFDFIKEVFFYDDETEADALSQKISQGANIPLIHIFSASIFSNDDEAEIILRKVRYVKQNIAIISNNLAALIFEHSSDYSKFLTECKENTKVLPENIPFEKMLTDSFGCIDKINSFLNFLTQSFDARYFNALSGDDYVIIKTSTNITKIKSEYCFYHLLPDNMKMWFVMPFDYKETKDTASYSMERYHVTDLAIKWVNNSLPINEFSKILSKLFYFLNGRMAKETSKNDAAKIAEDLYLNKVFSRLDDIKKSPIYEVLTSYISQGTQYSSIDDIFNEYKNIYESLNINNGYKLVIGHGDLCFSNIMYHNETSTLKFIDVKGALTKEDLWTNPYYDIAKLSHSICGRYDFFNSNLYEICLSHKLQFNLNVDFDNKEYVGIFKDFLIKYGFDYAKVRLYEASLFLSMLPLHIDYPKKVLGFLLNAIDILKEVKKCLKK